MTPRERTLHAYREADVPIHVAAGTVALWLLVAFPVWFHLETFDLPGGYTVVIAWALGGFVAAFFYFLST